MRPDPPGSDGFVELVDALHRLQDRVSGSAPPEAISVRTAARLRQLADQLAGFQSPERRQLSGHLNERPGRGQALCPELHIDEFDDDRVLGHVTFGRFYLGNNGAVHGGVLPLVFDEFLGRLAVSGKRLPSRTAYLHVNYRSITPIDVPLRLEARFDREEGRKRFIVGILHHGDVLCGCEGLFVQLLPSQP